MRTLIFTFLLSVCLASPGCPDDTPQPELDGQDSSISDATDEIVSDAGTDALDIANTNDGADAPLDIIPQCGPVTGARPSRISEHAGVYDSDGHQVVLFGGSRSIPVNCQPPTSTAETDTWLYDLRCDQWRQLNIGSPPGRSRHMAAYDSTRRRMIVFGGRATAGNGNYQLFNDLWALDLEQEQWAELPAVSKPAARVNGALVFDAARDKLILFGGNSSSTAFPYEPRADVWTYDFSTEDWTSHPEIAPGPAARLFPGATWDASRSRLLIFGGADNSSFTTAKYFADLWSLDISTSPPSWTQLAQGGVGGPQGRFWPGLVHDPGIDRYLLFGGHDDGVLGNRNDVWTFFPEQSQWVQIAAGDSFNKAAAGQCDFPPDFTLTDMNVPERRNAHVMVASDTALFVMGGKTDCGAVDDLVSMDFATSTWHELTIATVGLSCIRKGVLNCTDLCL